MEPKLPQEALSNNLTGAIGDCVDNPLFGDAEACGAFYMHSWWNEALAWGRTGWGNVARICRWSVTMGKGLPDGWCGPE